MIRTLQRIAFIAAATVLLTALMAVGPGPLSWIVIVAISIGMYLARDQHGQLSTSDGEA